VALAKADVGLGNVDNTADTAKPVSAAQQAAIDADRARLDSLESRRLDQVPVPTAAVALNGQRITGLAEPTAGQDAATKAIVDAVAARATALEFRTYPVERYGALPNTDCTAAFTAAIAAAVAAGGGVVTMAANGNALRYNISGVVTIPDRVALWGAGPRSTIVQALNAGARLKFEGNGGVSGNFTMTGANLALVGIEVGALDQRVFMSLESVSSETTLLLNSTQNTTWIGFKSLLSKRGIVFDRSARGNEFLGHTEVADFTEAAVTFQHTDDSFSVVRAGDNAFYGGMLEFVAAAVGSPSVGVVDDIGGGVGNRFHGTILSASAADAACSLVRGRASGRTRFTDCIFQGDLEAPAASRVTAFDLANNYTLELGTRCTIQQVMRRFFMDDTARVVIADAPYVNVGGTYFVSNGGALSAHDLIKWGQAGSLGDLPGIVAPSSHGWATATVALVAGRGYYLRFRVPKTMVVTNIAFTLTVAATVDDSVEVAIYDSMGARLATSGLVAGKLTTGAGLGVRTVPLALTIEPGTYYAALCCPVIGGTAATVQSATGASFESFKRFGASVPNLLACQQSGLATLPATMVPAFLAAALPELVVREA
jgi:hypothetical protein